MPIRFEKLNLGQIGSESALDWTRIELIVAVEVEQRQYVFVDYTHIESEIGWRSGLQ